MKHYIYKLYFEDSPFEIYIGQTNSLEIRREQHIREAFKDKESNKNTWIRKGLYRGQGLKMEILDEVFSEDVNQAEAVYIRSYVEDLKYTVYNTMVARSIKKARQKERLKSLIEQALEGTLDLEIFSDLKPDEVRALI